MSPNPSLRPRLEELGSQSRPEEQSCALINKGTVGLIRFGGYLPKGEYDVDHDGDEGQADAAELHG